MKILDLQSKMIDSIKSSISPQNLNKKSGIFDNKTRKVEFGRINNNKVIKKFEYGI